MLMRCTNNIRGDGSIIDELTCGEIYEVSEPFILHNDTYRKVRHANRPIHLCTVYSWRFIPINNITLSEYQRERSVI
jgi:hypothetical protein